MQQRARGGTRSLAMSFKNRKDAGRQLAAAVAGLDLADPVVLALPRGGVPVAAEVAARLNAPLDLVLVRKIGAPGQEELAVGAVVDGVQPEVFLNDDIVASLGIHADYIRTAAARELDVIEKRRALYLGARARVPVAGRNAIVVDDGIATGATMRIALRAVRRMKPKRLVLAVPVASSDALAALRAEVDDVVCLTEPTWFSAVGAYYADFSQTTDEEVIDALSPGRGPNPCRSDSPKPFA